MWALTRENLAIGVSDHLRLKQIYSATVTRFNQKYFTWSKFDYYIFQIEDNKGADQTAQMQSLICTFGVHM